MSGFGKARGTAFGLGEATVMIGALGTTLNLTPDVNSIGLAKMFSINEESNNLALTHGLPNDEVFSVRVSRTIRATCQGFEFTAKNLMYAAGQAGYNASDTQTVVTTVTAPVIANPNGSTSITVADASGFIVGNDILIQEGTTDNILARRITGIAVNELTVDSFTQGIALGAKVRKCNIVKIGSDDEQPFVSLKVVGRLADGTPQVLELPKVRITKGFVYGFMTNDYSNLPLEFQPLKLVPTDIEYDYYAARGNSMAVLYTPK